MSVLIRRMIIVVAALAVAALGVGAVAAARGDPSSQTTTGAAVRNAALAQAGRASITVDVAEDPTRYVFNGDHTLTEPPELAGQSAYGDFFVTQGFIYPGGTLDAEDAGVECEFDGDVPVDCQPLYEPIGEWTCFGVWLGDGVATQEGNIVVTTQIFELEDGGRSHTIVTDGFEPATPGAISRAITGGTGRYAMARGVQVQETYGLHPDQMNVRSTNTLRWRG